jgi:hypothetical protein
LKVLLKLPVELIDDVATCSVVPSYISILTGLKLDRLAPLNFRLLNLTGVNDGIGVIIPLELPQQKEVPAVISGSDTRECTDADAL